MDDPLLTTLLDLDAALGWEQPLIIGGGYGLYLKQLHLLEHPEIQTLFPLQDLPEARTTKDIDLILRAEVVTDSNLMKEIRAALDSLDFRVVETAMYTQFIRVTERGEVKIDMLAGPLGEFAKRVPRDSRRVKPRPRVPLHASKLEEALAVDRDAVRIPITGALSSGIEHQSAVFIPQAFSYLLMKLCAFRDRLNDSERNLGQHHALDIYRIVGLLTRDEDATVRRLSEEFTQNPIMAEVRAIASTHFISPDGMGRLRVKEHPLYRTVMDLDRLAAEIVTILGVRA